VISRVSFGWQTTIADLALILFMVTAAGVRAPQQHPAKVPAVSPPAHGEPLAVYRAQAGTPPLAVWLAEQAPDRRQRLTIVARYAPGEAAAAASAALDLAQEAGEGGVSARIMLEPGAAPDVLATLAFDQPEPAVARPLQSGPQD
jgi:hypothetical protein